jgi:WD40 repeat protein
LKLNYAISDKSVAPQEARLLTILQDAVERARSVTGADGAALAVQDADGIEWRASSGNAPAVGSPLKPDSDFTWNCFSSGQVTLCNDAEHDLRVGPVFAKGLHLSSLAAVPLRFEADGSVLGVIEVFSSRPWAFGASQVEGLVHIAQSVALRLASEMDGLEPASADRVDAPFPPATVPLAEARLSPPFLHIVEPVSRPVDSAPQDDVEEAPPEVIVPAVVSETASPPAKANATKPWLIAIVILLFILAAIFIWRRESSRSSSGNASTPSPATSPPFETKTPNRPDRTQTERVAPSRPSDSKAPYAVEDERTNPAGGYTTASKRDQISMREEGRGSPAPDKLPPTSAVSRGPALSPGPGAKIEARLSPPDLSISPNFGGVPDLTMTPTIPVNLAPITPPKFAPQRSFKGHSSWITAVAFNANGSELASASWDRSVKMWDLPSGEEVNTVTRKMKEVQTLAFSPDGRWLATENSSNVVTIWDAKSGREVLSLPGNKPLGLLGKSWVYSIAFSPNGRWLASGLDEKTIRIWDVETGLPVRDLAADRRSVIYVAFSADGRFLASGADDKTINIWDLTSGKVIHTLSGHTKNVYAVAFSPNGRWIASVSADKTVRLWDAVSGDQVHALTGHGSSVTSAAFSPDSRWLVSGSWDKTVKIWDVEKGQLVETLTGNTNPVYSVAFDSHGKWLASGSQDGTIRLWRTDPLASAP